jgi:hypothetical protein
MRLKSLVSALLVISLCALSACGGGSSNQTSSSSNPGTFMLELNTSSLGLAQSSSQSIQITSIPENGFSSSITFTALGLPSGVTASPPNLVLTAGSTGTLTFAASASAASGNAKITITGVSGSQKASQDLTLNVVQMATPVAMPYTTTGGGIQRAFYDEQRQLLFATNFYLNEVDVLSGQDLSIRAHIPVGQPFGIDQMPDGNTLVIGTFTQSFYTINENTLAVTQYLAPNFSQSRISTTVLLIPVTMSNGKVLFLTKDISVGGSGIYIYGGQAIVEWDASTGQFNMRYYIPYDSLEIDDLKRSADHNWAIFSSDALYIYSAASDGLTSSRTPVSDSPFGIRDVAVNPNGSQFAVVSAYSATFYDSSFNSLGTLDLGSLGGLVFDHYNIQYSLDGSLLYWEMFGDQGGGSVLNVINTTSYAEVGTVATNYGIQLQFPPNFLLVDGSQRGFFSALGGVGTVNCLNVRTSPPTVNAAYVPSPFAIPLNQSAALTLNQVQSTVPVGTSLTIGGVLAALSSDPTVYPLTVQAPPSSVAGPVNIVLTQLDGETVVEPQEFVYGLTAAAATSNLVPPIGNPALGLFGFGISPDGTVLPAVSVGGQNVTNLALNPNTGNIPQELYLQLPNGASGPADIVVSGSTGTSTLKAAVTYIPAAKIVPSGGLIQLLYDNHRALLYALQNTQIQVLDPVTLQWKNPLIPGGVPGTGYASMAITPDGSQLLVLDTKVNTLTVFNPDTPSQSVTTSVTPTGGATLETVVATNQGTAFIGSWNGSPLEFNLSTNTYTISTAFGGQVPSRFVATADGSYFAGVNQNSGGGTIVLWHNGSIGAQSIWGVLWADVAVSPQGTMAALEGNTGAAGVAAAFLDQNFHFTNATVYPDLAPPDQPFTTGAVFSTSGQTLVVPLADSIDFFDVETGRLRSRLLTPELLPIGDASSGAIVLDPNQQNIYAISASGLSVLTLPSSVDQLAPFPWPYTTRPRPSAYKNTGAIGGVKNKMQFPTIQGWTVEAR